MSKNRFIAGLAAVLLSVAAQAADPERVLVTTSMGSFVIELERDRAPLTVENFLHYVKSDHYANTLFHRVISNFLIQGGGVGTDYKAKPTLKPIPNEAGNGLKNLRGTVGLARASAAHSGDRQFFINVADNADLDPLPTRWGYAVFGHVIEGMDVVDRISVAPTGPAGPFKSDAPLRQVVIQKIELLQPPTETPASGEAAPSTPAPDAGTAPPAQTGDAPPPPADATPPADAPPPVDTPPPGAPPPK
jgi:peptidyl-prolyl cis-trans isomerase A (cyclophilin A)/peptidyl-prolyl cis-trans isomerase B (cyclophilin B)